MNITKTITIDPTKCVRCGRCIEDCVVEILTLDSESYPCISPGDQTSCLNCQHCYAVCPVQAITPSESSLSNSEADNRTCSGPVPQSDQMYNLIRQRRSVRRWSDAPIDEAVLSQLKRSLDWSPTGCNVHNLRFTFVCGQPEMDRFRKKVYSWINGPVLHFILRHCFPKFRRYLDEIRDGRDVVFRDAPYMVLASVPRNAPCAAFDPVIALTQFDLFAQTFGVGTCWCGFGLGLIKFIPGMRRMLKLPRGYSPGALMLFGKPSVVHERPTMPIPYFKEEIRSCTDKRL